MTKRFQGRYDGPKKKMKKNVAKSGTAGAADIGKLLHAYMEKPTLRPLYQVWAKSKDRPELDAIVDQRLQELRLAKNDPDYPRIGAWTSVVTERFATASEEERDETFREAKRLLEAETAQWKGKLAEPQNIEQGAMCVHQV